MSFSEDTYREKLSRLNKTQHSIETLSQWVLFYRSAIDKSVRIWEEELYKAPKAKKLTFLYLANDICQRSKRNGDDVTTAFEHALLTVLSHVYKEADSETELALKRLTAIWQLRQVFSPSFLDDSEEIMKSVVVRTESRDRRGAEADKQGSTAVPPPLLNDPVVEALTDVETKSVMDSLVEERVSGLHVRTYTYDPSTKVTGVSAHTLRREAAEAKTLLSDFKQRLEADIDRRNSLIAVLTTCIEQQDEKIQAAQEKVKICEKRISEAQSIVNEADRLVDTDDGENQLQRSKKRARIGAGPSHVAPDLLPDHASLTPPQGHEYQHPPLPDALPPPLPPDTDDSATILQAMSEVLSAVKPLSSSQQQEQDKSGVTSLTLSSAAANGVSAVNHNSTSGGVPGIGGAAAPPLPPMPPPLQQQVPSYPYASLPASHQLPVIQTPSYHQYGLDSGAYGIPRPSPHHPPTYMQNPPHHQLNQVPQPPLPPYTQTPQMPY